MWVCVRAREREKRADERACAEEKALSGLIGFF